MKGEIILKKMLFEFLISPLTISDNYFINCALLLLISFIAYRVAFKAVGDMGVRGEIGSLLHWIIRFVVVMALWFMCCVITFVTKFVINHITLLLILAIGLFLIVLISKKFMPTLLIVNIVKKSGEHFECF